MIIDVCPVNDELDIVECRLYELENVPDLVHVLIEADVDHQDHPKPYHISENLDRFDQWKDRIHIVRATGLPTLAEDHDPWAREYAQREFGFRALAELDADPDDIVLHGDIDEIPTALVVRNVRPRGFVAFAQRGHFFAVDWQYPAAWKGTVAGRVRDIRKFGTMREARASAKAVPNAGWHLSWLGGPERAMKKVGSFCHPEVHDRIVRGLADDSFLRDGIHVDGARMFAVDVDETWPKYVYERKCPETWFRPR